MCCTTSEHEARRLGEVPGERLGDRLGVPGAERAALFGYAEQLSFLRRAEQPVGTARAERRGSPPIGRNTYKYPRDIVQDVRLQKQISFTDRYKGEARLDLYKRLQPPERDRSAEHAYCWRDFFVQPECVDGYLPERHCRDCELRHVYQLELERLPVYTAPSCDFVQVPLLTCSEGPGRRLRLPPISLWWVCMRLSSACFEAYTAEGAK